MASKAIGFLNFKFGADLKGFDRAMKKAQKNLKKFGKNVQRTGQNLTSSLTLPIAGLAAVSLKTFADFEQGMLKVKAISGATDAEFKALTESAKLLGSTTMFTAAQVAELQLNLSKLGLTPTQINQSTESILNLAQATDSDLAQAATVTAKIMNAFGMEATDMQRITDVMADSFSSTALDMTKFETAMASVAPVAKMAGADIEKTTAILGVLVNNGVEASTAGTALRNIFLDLSKSGKTWDQAMNEINSSTEPLAVAMDMFGKRGANVATILAQSGVEIQNLTSDFRDSTGEAKAMAEIMDSGVAGSLRKMRSQLEGAAIQLGEQLVPIFQVVINRISKLVSWFSSLSAETQKSIVKWGLIVAAIGPALIIFGKMVVGVSGLIKLFGALRAAVLLTGTAFKALTAAMVRNPIGAVLTLITSAAAAYFLLGTNTKKATKAQKEFNGVTESTEDAIKRLSKSIGDMGKDSFQLQIEEVDDLIKKIKGFEVKESAFTKGVALSDEQKKQIQDLNMLLIQLKQKQFDAKQEADELAKSIKNVGEVTTTNTKDVDENKKVYKALNIELAHTKKINESLIPKKTIKSAEELTTVFRDLSLEQKLFNSGMGMFGDILTSSLDSALTSQENFFDVFVANIKKAIQSLLIQLAVMTLIKSLMGGGTAAFSILSIKENLGSIMGFADGGLVTGPTVGLIGEGIGTTASNPEVIAPLDKLKNFIGGGSQNVIVEGVIKGNDIFLSNRNTGTNRQRSV